MDNNLIEKYKRELFEMNKRSTASKIEEVKQTNNLGQNGGLIAEATVIRGLYPLSGVRVVLFTGSMDNMNIVDEDVTDMSGRTKTFILNAPPKEISLQSESEEIPYSSYNVLLSADGYLDNYHLNIPVFSGQIVLIKSNMLLKETAGVNKDFQIFDETPTYNL